MMKTLNLSNQQDHKLYQFDSVSHLARAIQATPASDYNTHTNAKASTKTNVDTNGMNRSQALKLALGGGHWTKGAENLQQVALPITKELQEYTLQPQITTEVAGFMPCVPAFLSGEPEAMFNINQTPTKKRHIKIGVNIAKAWNITDDESINLGRALLQTITQLQTEGYAVQLDGVWYVRNENEPQTHYNYLTEIRITLKKSDEHFSPANVAFALSSTAFCRRVCWRFAEGRPELDTLVTTGYGVGADLKNDDYDVWIPYLYSSLKHKVDTQENAQEWVTHLITDAIGQ